MIAAELQTEDMPNDAMLERESWCIEHFGPEAEFRDHVDDRRPWRAEYSGVTSGWWWYFAREEYATLFALRWL